ncbi:MAG: BF3164 family lipoprotein [Bacteroidales bacterium]|nr:BF3164 family lipoprotein [Bacteroidales bacterium]
MKCIINSVVCLSLLLLYACGSSHTEEPSVTMRQLQHERIELPDMLLASPGGIQQIGDELFIIDFRSDSLFHRVHVPRREYLGQYGQRGQGPEDFIHPVSLNSYGRNALCCYDQGTRRLKVIERDSLTHRLHNSTLLTCNGPWNFDVIPFGEGRFVVQGCIQDSLFAVIDGDGEPVCLAGEYPYRDVTERSLNPHFRAMAYQGPFRITPSGKMAFATANSKIMYIYRLEQDRLQPVNIQAEWYSDYMPESNKGGGFSVVFKSSVVAYRDLSLSDSRIYALYSGRLYREKGWYCQYIHAYDWEGNLKEQYQLDVPIIFFCVDESARRIYGIASQPNPELVQFEF